MSNSVYVIDSLSKSILFETSIEKISDAYAFATQMEEVGLDIEIIAPSLAESLIQSLGANDQEIEDYKKSLNKEIEDHDSSDFGCAVCPPKSIK
jgi:hypothetical protein